MCELSQTWTQTIWLFKRAAKVIGSSLEAEIKIHLDKNLESITKDIDFSELCITSKAEVNYENNIDANVLTEKAKGTKCPMCWKINEKGCTRSNCPQNS